MTTRTAKRLGRAVMGVAAATQLAACADNGPLGLDRTPAAGGTRAANPSRTADLTGCPQLEVPEGSKLAFHAYAAGVQIYRWNGAGWDFVAPSAVLYADADGQGVVGVHYGGPTWEGASGSRVIGSVLDRCTPSPNAIPWLRLGATATEGPGVFSRVAFIQRVNTAGGTVPASPGSIVGQEARVPYTAEYFFYRAP